MNYFCEAVITSKKNVQTTAYVVLEPPKVNEIPVFNERILSENNTYKIFVSEQRAKVSYVTYKVYSTSEDVAGNTQNDVFKSLIENKKAEYISGGDMTMDIRVKIKKKGKKKGAGFKIILALCFTVVLLGSIAVTYQLTSDYTRKSLTVKQEEAPIENTIDGMFIPEPDGEADSDSEQITISIDRSYSAIPKEDLQLKGNLVDGVAEIKLPEFDREDFFSHVPGYTFGFSTVPDSNKIEYYGGQKYKFEADTKLYRVLVKYGGGSGTKEDPYIINYYDQLELMAEEKARGYFKQTCNIEFPDWATHTSIDTVNELKTEPEQELFEYDGGGYYIKNINNPLFGKVSGAFIHDVNIHESSIRSEEYKNYGFIVCEAYNYQYSDTAKKKNYETGETVIRNCTVSRSGIHVEYPQSEEESHAVVTAHDVVAPDLIEYDDKGNPITTTEKQETAPTLKGDYAIGGISGLGGQIESCYVENLGIYCDIDKYFLYAGGISGKPANVTDSGVNLVVVTGHVFSSGGIAGSAGGSRKYNALGEELPYYYGGNIQGCMAYDVRLSSEFAAGGIVGMATSNASDPVISNCYAYKAGLNSGTRENGIIKKSGYNGGIIGSDGQDMNGHSIINIVSPAEYKYIGASVKSKGDESIRLAPEYAYYQSTILNVLNMNSVHKNTPSEIFTGTFRIDDKFTDDGGALAYPEAISKLFSKIAKKEE